jgi:hypothetical protein
VGGSKSRAGTDAAATSCLTLGRGWFRGRHAEGLRTIRDIRRSTWAFQLVTGLNIRTTSMTLVRLQELAGRPVRDRTRGAIEVPSPPVRGWSRRASRGDPCRPVSRPQTSRRTQLLLVARGEASHRRLVSEGVEDVHPSRAHRRCTRRPRHAGIRRAGARRCGDGMERPRRGGVHVHGRQAAGHEPVGRLHLLVAVGAIAFRPEQRHPAVVRPATSRPCSRWSQVNRLGDSAAIWRSAASGRGRRGGRRRLTAGPRKVTRHPCTNPA